MGDSGDELIIVVPAWRVVIVALFVVALTVTSLVSLCVPSERPTSWLSRVGLVLLAFVILPLNGRSVVQLLRRDRVLIRADSTAFRFADGRMAPWSDTAFIQPDRPPWLTGSWFGVRTTAALSECVTTPQLLRALVSRMFQVRRTETTTRDRLIGRIWQKGQCRGVIRVPFPYGGAVVLFGFPAAERLRDWGAQRGLVAESGADGSSV